MSKRTVSFHYLSIVREEDIESRREARRYPLSCHEIESAFRAILDSMSELSTGGKAKTVNTQYNQYFVEVVSYNEHVAFVRIGQQNPSNTYGLRDVNTLEQSEVPISPSQLLELYTYCLIDFSNCIISYIGVNGAPKISALKYLFNDHFSPRDHTTAVISAIMTGDILNMLVRKEIISAITIEIAVPSDQVLSDIGVGEDSFDSLRNIKYTTKTIKVVATRNRNLFSDNRFLPRIFESTNEQFGNRVKSFKVNAKDNDEASQAPYDLLNYHFTKRVSLQDTRDHDTLTSDTFRTALEETYRQSQTELERYTPTVR